MFCHSNNIALILYLKFYTPLIFPLSSILHYSLGFVYFYSSVTKNFDSIFKIKNLKNYQLPT